MTGIKTGLEPQLREIFISAYNKSQFDILLSDKLDFDREVEVGDGPFRVIVDNVVKALVNDGRLPLLVAHVAKDREHRVDLQKLSRTYAQALFDAGEVDGKLLRALDSWGLLPTVDVAPVTAAAAPESTIAGFQRRVTEALPELDSVLWATQLFSQIRRVCCIEMAGARVATGFLVGPNVVLTNHHAVKSAIEAKLDVSGISCLFDYYRRPDNGQLTEGVRVGLAAGFSEWHADSSPSLKSADEIAGAPPATLDQLDHALLVLAQPLGRSAMYEGGPKRGWIKVPETAPLLPIGAPISILQHPKSKEQKLTSDLHSVLSVGPTRLRHKTNTDEGASGSPCFDLDWKLVALHHFGDPDHVPAKFNQAVPIAAIRERLARDGKEALLGGDPPR